MPQLGILGAFDIRPDKVTLLHVIGNECGIT